MQRSDALAGRIARERPVAALGRPPGARLASFALAGIVVLALAIAGFQHATEPRGDAGVSIAMGPGGGVTVTNDSASGFHGLVELRSGSAAQTVPVEVSPGRSTEVAMPKGFTCRTSMTVRLTATDPSSTLAPEQLRLPCASAAP